MKENLSIFDVYLQQKKKKKFEETFQQQQQRSSEEKLWIKVDSSNEKPKERLKSPK